MQPLPSGIVSRARRSAIGPWTIPVALILTAGVVQAQKRQDLAVTFIGNMAVHVTDGSTSLVTDFPYESGAFGYMGWTKSLVPGGPKPLCLITHSHRDHFARDLASEYCARLLGPADAMRGFGGDVLPMSDTVSREPMTIRAIRTPHAGLEHYRTA